MRPITWYAVIVGALGAAIFGLFQGFSNGVTHLFGAVLHFSQDQQSTFFSILAIGACFGSLAAAPMIKKVGEKQALFLSFCLYAVVGALSLYHNSISNNLYPLVKLIVKNPVSLTVVDFYVLTLLRFIAGIAVGITVSSGPLYLSQIAPTKHRGKIGLSFQLMINVGIVGIYITNYFADKYHSIEISYTVITVLSCVVACLILNSPKTARYLYIKGHKEKAHQILQKLFDEKEIKSQLNAIKEETTLPTQADENARNALVKTLPVGMMLMLLQQTCGINAFIFFSTQIFKNHGVQSPFIATLLVGITCIVGVLLALPFVDHFGRKKLLYTGFAVMAAALFISTKVDSLAVLFIIFYIFAFQISIGPLAFLIASEIFPSTKRSLGMSLSILTGYLSNWLVVKVSSYYTDQPVILFASFAIFCLASLVFVYFFVPETKGMYLEEIQNQIGADIPMGKIKKQSPN